MTSEKWVDLLAMLLTGAKGRRRVLADLWEMRTIQRQARQTASGIVHFRGLRFEYLNPESLAFLFAEIFLAEPYRFRSTNESPRIIDGGVNVGMSVAYFKTVYPQSTIVGFEPHPEAYAVACRNVERNRFSGVDLRNAALMGTEGQLTLNFIPGEIMASTVTRRLEVRGEKAKSVSVPGLRLSPFLDSDVDMLKLDIEGAEASVLTEVGSKLRRAANVFIEFHQTRGSDDNRLSVVARCLEDNGFDLLITSTASSRIGAAYAPFRACGPVSSALIFAKRVG